MKLVSNQILKGLKEQAIKSPRKRAIKNYHPYAADPLQRMVNYMLGDTYVQPHKHEKPDKREMFVILEGRLLVIEFAPDGAINNHQVLDPSEGNYGAEIMPGIWHTLIPLSSYVVVFEVKDGPYNPEEDKHFAPWAPGENDAHRFAYNQEIIRLLDMG